MSSPTMQDRIWYAAWYFVIPAALAVALVQSLALLHVIDDAARQLLSSPPAAQGGHPQRACGRTPVAGARPRGVCGHRLLTLQEAHETPGASATAALLEGRHRSACSALAEANAAINGLHREAETSARRQGSARPRRRHAHPPRRRSEGDHPGVRRGHRRRRARRPRGALLRRGGVQDPVAVDVSDALRGRQHLRQQVRLRADGALLPQPALPGPPPPHEARSSSSSTPRTRPRTSSSASSASPATVSGCVWVREDGSIEVNGHPLDRCEVGPWRGDDGEGITRGEVPLRRLFRETHGRYHYLTLLSRDPAERESSMAEHCVRAPCTVPRATSS